MLLGAEQESLNEPYDAPRFLTNYDFRIPRNGRVLMRLMVLRAF